MALDLKQSFVTSQGLCLSVGLKQSITVLTLNRFDLQKLVNDELEKNPCLVELEGNQKIEKKKNSHSPFLKQYDFLDNRSACSLHQSLWNQISLQRLSTYEMECVQLVLQYIDDNGYLCDSLPEVSKQESIPLEDLSFALKVIQGCEPAGVGAQNMQECLLLQLRLLSSVPNLVEVILENHWHDFEKQNFLKVSQRQKVSPHKVKEAFSFIRHNLDPKPARQFTQEITRVVVPDVYVFKKHDKWICSLNLDGLPRLRLSKKYTKILYALTAHKETALYQDKETTQYLSEKMRQARHLLRALRERNKTILRVVEVIVQKQIRFFEARGKDLVPLLLKDVAKETDLHESTISRSTAGKYVHTSFGVYELKYFFHSSLKGNESSQLTNESVKNWLMAKIQNEDKQEPFSDQELSLSLKKEKNIEVARRTVSKYRESLGILSSSKRAKKY